MNYIPSEVSCFPQPSADDEATAIAAELRSLWHGLLRESERATHLDRQQYWVLSSLRDGPQRMSWLADAAQTSQASLTGIVDRLEDHGLVRRVRSSEDRRVVDVALTASGAAELDRKRVAFAASLECILSPLTADERVQLLDLLRTLTTHLAGKAAAQV